MADGLLPSALDALPRLGWIDRATPVTPLPGLAEELGLEWLGVKRDDRLEPVHGSTKLRKLDFLLASAPYADAPVWTSIGATGSGHLAACTAAARQLGRTLLAHVFWQPPSARVLENLAFIVCGPTRLVYSGSRARLLLRRPGLWLDRSGTPAPLIPPGATCASGMLGMVRAGLELAQQVRAGELPEPLRLYVALGSGGTAAGLAVGLRLGGLETVVHAVSVVERPFSTRRRFDRLMRAVLERLLQAGVLPSSPAEPSRVVVDRSQLGAGYGKASRQALDACERLEKQGLQLEPVYTGKAFAALLADARKGGVRTALFWNTAHAGLPLPPEGWKDRLPRALARRLAEPLEGRRRISRRHFVLGGAAAAGAAVLAGRITGYPQLDGWHGAVLSVWQAHLIVAAAEALLPPLPDGQGYLPVAIGVDRYLTGMPPDVLREIGLLTVLIEHGTTPLGLRLSRFTQLEPAQRTAYLTGLASWGGLLAQASRGIRDLCMIGYYQQEASWAALQYDGPWVAAHPGPRSAGYAALAARAGALPQGVVP